MNLQINKELTRRPGKAAPPLDERIAAAFRAGTTSAAVAELIQEAEIAATTADEAAQRARERALDPALSLAEVELARRQMEDSAFLRDRMSVAVAKLGVRLVELRAQEENARRWLAYEAALAERDRLAAEMKEVYPALAERLADLAGRVHANDCALARINARALPNGAAYLAGAEQIARGPHSFVDGVNNIPRLTEQLRLPAFVYDPHVRYTWPRPGMSS